MLVACGGALAGGARLALSPRFDPATFWDEVRRIGATVVVHAGDMCEALCAMSPHPAETRHAIRVFVGYGLRPDTRATMLARFGRIRVLDLYAATEAKSER